MGTILWIIYAKQNRALAGFNAYGQLGDGTTKDHDLPTPVSASVVSSWLAISAGGEYTCGLAVGSSAAYCWGESPPRPAKSPQRQVL
jgi:hypothetical protein